MILLAIDTSGPAGGIALARCEAADCDIFGTHVLEGGNFSAQLVPEIAALLAKHKIGKHEIDAFVVVSGPGSFTGLRVGLSAVKGLAEILQKPISAVSLLEAVALAGARQGSVIAVLDAGRRQVFAGAYEIGPGAASCQEECLLRGDELAAYAAGRPILTPDKAVGEVLHSDGVVFAEVGRPKAGEIARIGWRKLASGLTADVAGLEANYIRRTDAEILLQGK
jgi:tRNA threonylcarbamoyladenosine biosynthesis protein TsaB